MGIVPCEHSTGGQQKLLGISKRGNSYLRKLFVQGARAVNRCLARRITPSMRRPVSVTRGHSNRKAKSGLKIIVRGAGLPGRHTRRVSRDRRPKVIR